VTDYGRCPCGEMVCTCDGNELSKEQNEKRRKKEESRSSHTHIEKRVASNPEVLNALNWAIRRAVERST
jgi:hypothetical protein